VIGSGRSTGHHAILLTPVVGGKKYCLSIQSLVPQIMYRCHFFVAHSPYCCLSVAMPTVAVHIFTQGWPVASVRNTCSGSTNLGADNAASTVHLL
jgi:hypothetical protein